MASSPSHLGQQHLVHEGSDCLLHGSHSLGPTREDMDAGVLDLLQQAGMGVEEGEREGGEEEGAGGEGEGRGGAHRGAKGKRTSGVEGRVKIYVECTATYIKYDLMTPHTVRVITECGFLPTPA